MLLPQPDSPTRPKRLAAPDAERDVLHGGEALVPEREVDPQVVDLEQGRRAHARPLPSTAGRGCRAGRRPSRFSPSTVMKIARPGKTEIQGAVVIWSRASDSMLPQLGKGGRMPRPRNESARFGQNRAAHAERADDDDRPQHVGQELRQHDAEVAVAQDLRGLHVALALERQRRGAREAAGEGPVGETERDQQRLVRPGVRIAMMASAKISDGIASIRLVRPLTKSSHQPPQ